MKKLAFGSWLVGVVVALAACGGGGGTKLIDGGVDAPPSCNPVAQTGCMTGQKCTWIIDIDGTATTPDVGHIGCAPAGTTPDGGTCLDATATANGGADTCVAGDLCLSRKCKPICDPQVLEGSSAAGACANNYACSVYSSVFETSGQPTAGVCEATCDPLTQRLNVGSPPANEACGSADPTRPSGTCVVGARFRTFHCAPTGSMLYGLTDRKDPLRDPTGRPFGNGCAPGFIPFFFEDASGAMKELCSGLCAPVKMDKDIAASAQTPANVKPWGDLGAMGKLVADSVPTPGHAVCTINVKGSIAADAQGKGIEDCRFLWALLAPNADPARAVPTQYNNTLGICFAYSKFVDIMVGATMQPEKSCADLPVTAPTDDPFGNANENGCYPLPNPPVQPTPAFRSPTRTATFRLGYDEAPITRHVFD